MAVKLETEDIRNLAAFEKITKVHARDCIITDNCIYFLVDSKRWAWPSERTAPI